MKILMCHNYYKLPGGEDQVFHDEGWLLEKHGHTVVRFQKHNSEIERLGKLEMARRTISNSGARIELEQLIDNANPDLLHFHNTFPLISPDAYRAAKSRSLPVVQSLHNFRMICPGSTLFRNGGVCEKCTNRYFAWPAIIHGCYRNSRSANAIVAIRNAYHWIRGSWSKDVDVFIALTSHSRDVFVAAGLPKSKIVVKPNFVRPDPGQRAREGAGAVYVGRLSPEKGIGVLLDAWLEQQCSIPLTIIGDGPMRDQVSAAVAENSRIRWLGQLPFESVLEKIRDSQMLIMPSIWYETFGRSMIEAFAAGVPVIASDIGAMREVVSDGQNGLYFRAGDAKDLADKILFLIQNDEFRITMGNNARREFVGKFSAEKNYELLMHIYDQAKSKRGSSF